MKKYTTVFFLLLTIQGIGNAQDTWIDSLKNELKISMEDTTRVIMLSEISGYFKFKRLDSALFYGNKALELARKISYPNGEIAALMSMTLSETVAGNSSKATKMCMQAIKIAEKNNLPWRKPGLLMLLGNINLNTKDYTKAMKLYRESNSLFSATQEHFTLIQVKVSETYFLMGQLDSAIYYCQSAYDQAIRLKQIYSAGQALYLLGRIQQKMGNPERALEYFHEYLGKMYPEANMLFNIYYSIAQLYRQTNEVDSSAVYAKKSLTIAEEATFYSNIVDANIMLADIYEHLDAPTSLRYSRMAIAYKDTLNKISKATASESLMDFDEQERQYELETAQAEFQNRLRMNIFLGSTFTLLVIAFFLYRNNRQKQKANALLKEQKEEVQSTLEKLKSTQSQLIQSEKMASLGELTAGIAHEIQNPLNFVNNFSEVNTELIDEASQEIKNGNILEVEIILNDIKENEQKINHHGKRADAIVKGMLQHSRTSTGQKEPTDINALADEYLRLAYHGMRAKDKSFNSDFKLELDESLPKINVVPQDIGRVLLNFINNAFYAVNEKVMQNVNDYKPLVVVITKLLGNKVEIRVQDNGNGIPESVKEKIFQPFFTTKPTGQGTGLGLSLSYDIVKAHGGSIQLKSQENVGTEFIIHFPVN